MTHHPSTNYILYVHEKSSEKCLRKISSVYTRSFTAPIKSRLMPNCNMSIHQDHLRNAPIVLGPTADTRCGKPQPNPENQPKKQSSAHARYIITITLGEDICSPIALLPAQLTAARFIKAKVPLLSPSSSSSSPN